MAVPSVISDLNVAAASNSPAGTDPIGNTLDDFLRAIQAIVRREQAQGAVIASAATTNIGGNTDGSYLHISGTTTITSFGTVAAGISRTVVFDGVLTLTHNSSSLILPNGANITTAAGDVAQFVSEGSGNWRCIGYVTATPTQRMRRFTGSGSMVVPLGVTQMFGSGCGGGGGGGAGAGGTSATGSGGGGGGAGASTIRQSLTVSPGEILTMTIASAGSGSSGAGTAGGATTIVGSVSGTLLTLSGGTGGAAGTNAGGGSAGGSGGNGFPAGSDGQDTSTVASGAPSGSGGAGASGPFGGGGGLGRGASVNGVGGKAAAGYGAGGGGGGGYYTSGGGTGGTGGNGSPGLVIIEW